jgi:hypothetical protein
MPLKSCLPAGELAVDELRMQPADVAALAGEVSAAVEKEKHLFK